MLTIPASRRAFEEARALEIETAHRALVRSRLGWYAIGLATIGLGLLLMALAFRTRSSEIGQILFWSAILVGDVGPMTVLVTAVRSEEG